MTRMFILLIFPFYLSYTKNRIVFHFCATYPNLYFLSRDDVTAKSELNELIIN